MHHELFNSKWKSFRFDEIFTIKGGYYNKKPPFSINGNIAFIGASDSNNGITGFCKYEDILNCSKTGSGKNHDISDKLFEGNCITVTNNGSVGHAYYQKNKFTCSHDINILYLKNYDLNEYLAMFLIDTIQQQKVCYDYSRKWRPIRMRSSNILLPVDKNGNPDYENMEKYIKKRYQNQNEKIVNYLQEKLKKLKRNNVPKLSEKNWRDFYIHDIFEEVQRGKRLIEANFIEGNMPYISSKASNNGIKEYIGNTENVRIFENCLTLANSGSVGSTFYHPYTFVASDHITQLKNEKFDKNVYLFLATMIKRLGEKYHFNREISDERLEREIISLPITNEGNPDYEYMKQYIINLEIELLTKYQNYIQNKIYSEYISEKESLMM